MDIISYILAAILAIPFLLFIVYLMSRVFWIAAIHTFKYKIEELKTDINLNNNNYGTKEKKD